jgi:hypothetical protein
MMSLFTLTDSIGKGIGPVLGGLLIGVVGYRPMLDLATISWLPCGLVVIFLLTPQYPKDVLRLETIMEERAREMEKAAG